MLCATLTVLVCTECQISEHKFECLCEYLSVWVCVCAFGWIVSQNVDLYYINFEAFIDVRRKHS